MSREIFLLTERKGTNRYDDFVAFHVGFEDKKIAHCGKTQNIGSAWYSDPDDDQFCPECVKKATLTASDLVKLLESVEEVTAALRGDVHSLYKDGAINEAIGSLKEAAKSLLDEAKDRALQEVKGRR